MKTTLVRFSTTEGELYTRVYNTKKDALYIVGILEAGYKKNGIDYVIRNHVKNEIWVITE